VVAETAVSDGGDDPGGVGQDHGRGAGDGDDLDDDVAIGRGIGAGLSGLQWIFVKVFGVVSVLVAVLLLYLLSITGFDFKILLGAVVLGGYGVYLLVPGERKWLFFWW